MSESVKVTINDTSINNTNEDELSKDESNHKKNNKSDRNNYGKPGTHKTAFLLLLLWGCCIVFRFVGIQWSKVKCSHYVDESLIEVCIQHGSIYRVTTVTIGILVIQTIASLYSVDYYDYYWILKYPTFILCSFALLYPVTYEFNDESFEWISRIFGFLFLIFQQLLVLDFAYYFNETLLQKAGFLGRVAESGVQESDCGIVLKNGWLLILLVAAAVNFSVFIISFILLYHYFAPAGSHCKDNTSIISITLALMLLAVLIQVSGSNGSVTTSSILAIYITYLIYTALSLNPNTECNSSIEFNGGNDRVGPVVLGIIISFLSIAYAAIVTSKSVTAILNQGTYSGIFQIVSGKQSHSSSGITGTKIDFKGKLRQSIVNLNFIYILLAFYISMTLTNWGTISYNGKRESSLESGSTSMWITAAAAWICIALYIFQLLIPNFNIVPKSVWDFKV